MLGDTAMHKMAGSKIFITGLGGLGVEIGQSSCHIDMFVTFLCS